MKSSKVQYYVLICDKKEKKRFIELLASFGGVCIDTMYGRGSAHVGAFATALGLDVEEHKVVISCLIATEKAELLTKQLTHDYNFKGKNTGFAFSISLEALSI